MDPFQPVFNFDIYVNNPDGSRNRVNPENCLYPNSAFKLSQVLGSNGYPCAIVPGPALGPFGSVFAGGYDLSSSVPWLQFDGNNGPVYERAGSIAAFWIRATNADTGQTDQKTALRNAISDIKNVIEGN